jgi:hypothetical protein
VQLDRLVSYQLPPRIRKEKKRTRIIVILDRERNWLVGWAKARSGMPRKRLSGNDLPQGLSVPDCMNDAAQRAILGGIPDAAFELLIDSTSTTSFPGTEY